MPGSRNPFKPIMASAITGLSNAVSRARTGAEVAKEKAREFADEHNIKTKLVDLTVKFIGARELPKMDMVGTADPYFVAKLDGRIIYVSSVVPNTQTPVWDELWSVKNVPADATLQVEVLDKDEGSIHDDYIGKFETTIAPGAKEVELVSTVLKSVRGSFWLDIQSKSAEDPNERRYIFDGPIRFTRHFSPTVGKLTKINDERLYSTWKVYIKGVPTYFRDEYQHWNTKYRAAQTIFGFGPTSYAVRSSIRSGHRMLYARSTRNEHGTITTREDVIRLLRGGKGPTQTLRVKPAVYTYIISAVDDSLRFSETGAAFFVDFASKHALHANCAEKVRYSGEFHPRPACGWENFNDETSDDDVQWEFIVDNNSGTYSPDPKLLPDLKALLEYNFLGLKVVALDHDEPELERSREACRAYALSHRGVRKEELQPYATEGEETLQHHASVNKPMDENPEERPVSQLDSHFEQLMRQGLT